MTDEELDAAVADTLIPIPMRALDALMAAANGSIGILGQGERPSEEQLAEAMRAHTKAMQAIAAAFQRAMLELTAKPTGAPLH